MMSNIQLFALTVSVLALVVLAMLILLFSFQGEAPSHLHYILRSSRYMPRNVLPDSCMACASDLPVYLHKQNEGSAHQSNVKLVDFSCQIGSESYFHVLLDCLAPISGLLSIAVQQSAQGVLHAYVPTYLNRFWPWYHQILARSNINFHLINQPDKLTNQSLYSDVFQQTCFSPYVIVQNRNKMHTAFPDIHEHVLPDGGRSLRQQCKPCFRDFVYDLEGIPPASEPMQCKYIIVISRSTPRRIINEQEMVTALSRIADNRGLSVVSVNGNESMPDVVHLFASACAVIGYHGAGHTNTIFSRSTALIIEVTTFSAPAQSSKDLAPRGNDIWRSNKAAVQEGIDHTGKWVVYYVGYEQLWPSLNQSLFTKDSANSQGDVSSSWDKYLKYKSVILTRQDVQNIATIVDAHLDDIAPCLAGVGHADSCRTLVDRRSDQKRLFSDADVQSN
jgi:hypothetical protein